MIGNLLRIALQMQIAAADIPPIVNAALDVAAPVNDSIGSPRGTMRIADRPLLLDVAQTARAFREMDSRLPATLPELRLDRPFVSRERNEAIACSEASGRRSCRVADNGIYVAIKRARRADTPDELVVSVEVPWNGDTRPVGYASEIALRRMNGSWIASRRSTAAM